MVLISTAQNARSQTPVTICGQLLASAGEYRLMNDLNCTAPSGDFDGVRISASNVVFHLGGHTISSSVCDQTRNITGIFVGGGITNVTIDGGSVFGFNDGVVLSSSNSLIKGVRVTQSCMSGVHVQGSNNRVEKVTATGNGDGVSVLNGVSTVVRANYLTGNTRTGVAISGNSLVTLVEDNIIDNNGSVGGYGVAVFNGSDSTIRDNAVNYNRNGIFLSAPNNTVRNNTINGSTDVGISITPLGSPSDIRRNTVLNSGGTDMTDDSPGCGANTWRNNTFVTDLVNGVPNGGPNVPCLR